MSPRILAASRTDGFCLWVSLVRTSIVLPLLNSLPSTLVMFSFPPAIGHTTSLYVCGFAYGLKGFPVALAGSILGSTLAFVTLRLLFSRRLRAWSSTNERWQALEAVVVRPFAALGVSHRFTQLPCRMPRVFLLSYSSELHRSRRGCTQTCYLQYVL